MEKTKKHGKNLSRLLFIVFFFIFLSFLSCKNGSQEFKGDVSGIDQYYFNSSKENREQFLELFNLLKMEEPGSEGEFAVTREIAVSFAKLGDYEKLIHFLSARAINNPTNPYNGWFYLMIAHSYMRQNSEPIAAVYFDLIVKNYPDLIINGESIHLVCLRNLINQNGDSQRQVWYYQELISRFPDKIDLGTAYFMLGQACERAGDWNGAIAAYTNYLPFTGTVISGFPKADLYARQQVDFSRSSKDWTFESLPALRSAVEAGLNEANPFTLMRYQAKVNFFARSWEQMETSDMGMANFDLAKFMYSTRITYAPTLDALSTANEAFLRTTGWSWELPTWYLYFRKIYFPQDPEIHGRWEWAGIYYGEKF